MPAAQPDLIWLRALPVFNEVLRTDVSESVYAHVPGSGWLAQCLHLSVSEFGHLGLFPPPDGISARERVCVSGELIACVCRHVEVFAADGICTPAVFARCPWVTLGDALSTLGAR